MYWPPRPAINSLFGPFLSSSFFRVCCAGALVPSGRKSDVARYSQLGDCSRVTDYTEVGDQSDLSFRFADNLSGIESAGSRAGNFSCRKWPHPARSLAFRATPGQCGR